MSEYSLYETWLPIHGLPMYEVSDFGRIRSLKFGKTRILRLAPARGYLSGTACVDGKRFRISAHVCAARSFIGPRPAGYEACHNDGNKRNNHISNIRYDTPQGNSNDKYRHGTVLMGEDATNAKLDAETVLWIKRFHAEGWIQKFICILFQVKQPTVSHILRGRSWRSLADLPRSINSLLVPE